MSSARSDRPVPDEDPDSGSDTLQLLVGGDRGEPEMLLLIERPGTDRRVRVRSWTSDDWSSPPMSGERGASDLLQDVERWSRAGRSLNQPLQVVRRWLEK